MIEMTEVAMLPLPTDLIFWLAIPGLAFVLVFAWLALFTLKKQRVDLNLSGLGITLSLSGGQRRSNSALKE